MNAACALVMCWVLVVPGGNPTIQRFFTIKGCEDAKIIATQYKTGSAKLDSRCVYDAPAEAKK